MIRVIAVLLFCFYSTFSFSYTKERLLEEFYPMAKDDASCQVMKEADSEKWCVAKVIEKDFSQKGDYHYFIVLGDGDECHTCAGLVDLYAYNKKTAKLISLKAVELGAWGKAPTEWSFKKDKQGRVVLSTETDFVQGGNVETTQYHFYVLNNRFKFRTVRL